MKHVTTAVTTIHALWSKLGQIQVKGVVFVQT